MRYDLTRALYDLARDLEVTLALSFAARLMVANCIIMGCIWYLLILWAGEGTFMSKLQRMVDRFVWKGRNRVARATVTLGKAEEGLGQIDIAAQYRTLTGSLIIWVTSNGPHPLKQILRDQIGRLSQRRWGSVDLTWVVSQCGSMTAEGSTTWRNICRGWQGFKPFITESAVNISEWRELPLWRPHVNHILTKKVCCSTRAQKSLQGSGLRTMGDIMEPDGRIISWAAALARGLPSFCHNAFTALVDNLVQIPVLDNSHTLQEFYVEAFGPTESRMVWKFLLPPARCTTQWLPFLDRSTPKQTFIREGQSLRSIALRPPDAAVWLRRIVVLYKGYHKEAVHGGLWMEDNIMLTQYLWKGGPQLTTYSTASIRQLQNQQQARTHPAIRKWEIQLGTRLPDHVWHNTWLPFRAAKVNMFLWLVLFRAIATLSWVFPNRSGHLVPKM